MFCCSFCTITHPKQPQITILRAIATNWADCKWNQKQLSFVFNCVALNNCAAFHILSCVCYLSCPYWYGPIITVINTHFCQREKYLNVYFSNLTSTFHLFSHRKVRLKLVISLSSLTGHAVCYAIKKRDVTEDGPSPWPKASWCKILLLC